jgi:hypothetical protein
MDRLSVSSFSIFTIIEQEIKYIEISETSTRSKTAREAGATVDYLTLHFMSREKQKKIVIAFRLH